MFFPIISGLFQWPEAVIKAVIWSCSLKTSLRIARGKEVGEASLYMYACVDVCAIFAFRELPCPFPDLTTKIWAAETLLQGLLNPLWQYSGFCQEPQQTLPPSCLCAVRGEEAGAVLLCAVGNEPWRELIKSPSSLAGDPQGRPHQSSL